MRLSVKSSVKLERFQTVLPHLLELLNQLIAFEQAWQINLGNEPDLQFNALLLEKHRLTDEIASLMLREELQEIGKPEFIRQFSGSEYDHIRTVHENCLQLLQQAMEWHSFNLKQMMSAFEQIKYALHSVQKAQQVLRAYQGSIRSNSQLDLAG